MGAILRWIPALEDLDLGSGGAETGSHNKTSPNEGGSPHSKIRCGSGVGIELQETNPQNSPKWGRFGIFGVDGHMRIQCGSGVGMGPLGNNSCNSAILYKKIIYTNMKIHAYVKTNITWKDNHHAT
jgi:hypothetical protein